VTIQASTAGSLLLPGSNRKWVAAGQGLGKKWRAGFEGRPDQNGRSAGAATKDFPTWAR